MNHLNPQVRLLESLIGNTPMVRVRHLLPPDCGSELWLKLEGQNPAGSVKDRAAISMIGGAEGRGEISPGDTLIEATSGNTGIALAMAATLRGYRMCLVMPENMSLERRAAMHAFGAEIILSPAKQSMEGAIDLAREMQASGKGHILDQFANPDNPLSHYKGTGPEIWSDTDGRITHFVSSMGTTGTIMGTSRFLKEKSDKIRVVGVQPESGAKIPGIRCWPEAYLPKIYDRGRVDSIVHVSEEQAKTMTLRLGREEGVFAGPSSGGCVHCAIQVAHENDPAVVVAIVCDRGDRYISTGLFNP
ncbi:MAG: cysteine synthase CysM [Candidatus Porifericomitaceae bacterium WSBS_2022_MAG_OTU9]